LHFQVSRIQSSIQHRTSSIQHPASKIAIRHKSKSLTFAKLFTPKNEYFMSVLVNKNSKILVQGFTGTEGTFHAAKAAQPISTDPFLIRWLIV
jgi:hypothetical protein